VEFEGKPLFAFVQDFVRTLAFGDVPHDFGGTNDPAGFIANRGYGERNVNRLTVAPRAHRVEVFDAFSGAQPGENRVFLRAPVGGNYQRDVTTNGLRCGITEQTLGCGIPRSNYSIESLADDRVSRGIDDRGKQACSREPSSILLLQTPMLRHVAENQYAADDVALFVLDGAALSSIARSLPSLRTRMAWFASPTVNPSRNAPAAGFSAGCRVCSLMTRNTVSKGLAQRVFLGPAHDGFSHRIQKRDTASDIRCDDGIADAGESDTQQLLALAQLRLGTPVG
jgi:hypothetical protein